MCNFLGRNVMAKVEFATSGLFITVYSRLDSHTVCQHSVDMFPSGPLIHKKLCLHFYHSYVYRGKYFASKVSIWKSFSDSGIMKACFY